ncbi:class I SAM-dependent methyltransferase [Candidatus Woesearchaeota archaeon]|nr:class I SAM-dependent methyltransferase [Candidatus Woesearchaeota archaeon]
MDYKYIAKSYDELHKEEQLKKLDIIKSQIRVSKASRLLDIGCGTGISTNFFKCKSIGIDPSKEMISISKEKNLFYGESENLLFKDKEFDMVISITAIHNFRDPEKALDEMLRVAKKTIVITLLKKANKYKELKELIKYKLKNVKEIDEEKDTIFISKIQ